MGKELESQLEICSVMYPVHATLTTLTILYPRNLIPGESNHIRREGT